MKKKAVMIVAMAGLFLVACTSQNADQSTSPDINANAETEQVVTASNEASSEQRTTSTFNEEEMYVLEKEIAAMEEKAENSSANGTFEENKASYLAIDQELEQIEDKIDRYEDEIEADYTAGTVSQKEYNDMEYQLEQLENRLEVAENILEEKYRMDD